ncbi:hypothetical protein RIF29_22256 [Crotalaria pallida]|uniref:Uncharacterized protein n=1 Tax=Crotalaria pallida TaxID=3830 RepID=A0AAN9F6T0_CROPI
MNIHPSYNVLLLFGLAQIIVNVLKLLFSLSSPCSSNVYNLLEGKKAGKGNSITCCLVYTKEKEEEEHGMQLRKKDKLGLAFFTRDQKRNVGWSLLIVQRQGNRETQQ